MKRKTKVVGSLSLVGVVGAILFGSLNTLDKVESVISSIKHWVEKASQHWEDAKSLRYAVVGLAVFAVISALYAIFYRLRYYKLSSRVYAAKLRQRQLVLFVPPTLEGFYGEYLSALVTAARLHAGTEREITILPHFTGETDFCPEQRLHQIVCQYTEHDSILKGVFVIPRDPSANKEALTKGLSHDYPIVTLDVYPDAAEDPSYPHFVGGNEATGGRCAATAAIDLLEERLPPDSGEFRILVLIGATTPWESQRVRSFQDRIQNWAQANQVQVTLERSTPLNYEYRESVEYLENWEVRVNDEGGPLTNPLHTDLIFACSDTMALGAAKALRHLMREQPNGEGSKVKVIGYDGTIGMKRALGAGSDLLWATVDVRLDEQARRAVEVMMELMRSNHYNRRMTLVQPTVLRP